MNKYLVSLAIYFLVITLGQAQEEEKNTQASDSIKTTLNKEGVKVVDTLKVKKKSHQPPGSQ
ncbi:MAG: hypothetical protein R3294_01875 [Arenibacter troitsensis]|nr:hypothetical protein [Arenibacter troitsensis]